MVRLRRRIGERRRAKRERQEKAGASHRPTEQATLPDLSCHAQSVRPFLEKDNAKKGLSVAPKEMFQAQPIQA